ncbi:nucleolar complex protein 3 homolog isoform X2 [Arabidopsis lyrata subsp. lyrata]|uniref:nucleolar complex protein 3 homolog isoform X2 n=1 Tax=Arabidopsis lyrata subsp. lyrata TaxID=81972 RepID=UPI000A29B57E|nr:nucleolar complex protein 3 homolog isoform X2 [Arabidopsis lyrata subsp. lyrata]|eukprot:XP_020890871.1 nucleolar complex protein 3 homolog isoform X2 [Arabidopsis lyrata subsp. lyrata]
MGKSRRKQKVIPPPQLPPDVPDEDIEFSDEDLKYVEENTEYARFVSRLDTAAINKQCGGRVKTVEDKYEEERSKKKTLQEEKGNGEILVDPVDVLPVKTLDGKLHYRTESKKSKLAEADTDEAEKDVLDDENLLNKSQRREKAKKSKREAKKHDKDFPNEILQEEETPQAAVLAEVKEELSAAETFENKKNKLAELGMLLLSDPEANIKSLKEMLDICKDENTKIVKLGLLSLLAVFKDIIPGYRIRLPTEKELEMKISKEVKKTRFYESTLLKAYKKLIIFETKSVYNQIANRCLCTLLEAVPHFNYRDNLLIAVVRNISSPDEVVRRLCCSTIRSLFSNEGKHGGELTVQAVRLIADHVKAHNCQLHPNAIEVFMSIRFDEDIGKRDKEDEHNKKYKKNNKRKAQEEQNQVQENERKKSKQEMMSKIRDEVSADYRGVTYEPDAKERRKMQTETLSAVFETYFRILRNTMYTIGERTEENPTSNPGAFGSHPLLAPCLDGLAKFTQQLDLDYIGDLMNYLKKLASSSSVSNNTKQKNSKLLTVSERLRCCLVAFKVMRSNLNALNVDLQDFFVQLYNLILEYRPGRDSGVVLAESLKIMLCDDRHQDMQKAAAFVKRLATFALCFGCAESMSALVTLKTLLQKNVKCRNLLENDAGGGSVSGSIAKYQPYATDPNLSGALATVLWELSLLSKHYHPAISTMATTVSNMNTSQSQTFLSAVTPQQAFADFSLVKESFELKNESRKLNKRKRESLPEEAKNVPEIDMVKLSKKLKENFTILRDIKEDKRVRMELQSEKKKPMKKQINVVKKKLKNPKSKKKI